MKEIRGMKSRVSAQQVVRKPRDPKKEWGELHRGTLLPPTFRFPHLLSFSCTLAPAILFLPHAVLMA